MNVAQRSAVGMAGNGASAAAGVDRIGEPQGRWLGVLAGRRAGRVLLAALACSALSVSMASAATEVVTVVKVLKRGDKGIIERRNGERWLIENGAGAVSFWQFEGKEVLIQSPALFCGAGSTLILPDVGQQAMIWDAELIESKEPATELTDVELTVLALFLLEYYIPESRNKVQSDVVQALKAFQKWNGLKQTGRISAETQLALAEAVASAKPVTTESRRLALLLEASALQLAAGGAAPREAGKPFERQALPARAIESQVDGAFTGWQGGTVVRLTNGQVWQQKEAYFHYRYAFRPSVVIVESNGQHVMAVDGVPKAVAVERLK